MVTESPELLLRVSNRSNPGDLAAAISHGVYDSKKVVIRAIGAAAVNQAVKAIAIARGYVAQRGLDLSCIPGFTTVQVEGEEHTAIVLKIVAS